jgi:hypothetical protein
MVRNQFTLRLINKRHETSLYQIELMEPPAGMRMMGAESAIEVPPLGEVEKPVIVTISQKDYVGKGEITIRIHEQREHGSSTTQRVEFLGPDPRFFQNRPTPPSP